MKDKTVIIVATMHRVGSTKIFNTIRKIYEVSGENYYSSFIDHTTISPAYNYKNLAKNHIIKLHSPSGFFNNKVISDAYSKKLKNFDNSKNKKIFWITAKRDLRDMASSQVRVGKYYPHFYNINSHHFNEINNSIVKNLSWYHAYKNISDYEVSYEDFLTNPKWTIKKLSNLLGKKLTEDQVQLICKSLDELGTEEGIKKMDEKTKIQHILVDHHHITSTKQPGEYQSIFSKDIIAQIEKKFGQELKNMGYKLSSSN